ncbi:Cof-type HAD-IIB family hydrolase [Alkalicoccus saliphilus]|uniref:Phosphoglycolate phosphatase n=1 Tax=Alkalicoccus saliphilus TaxID=200989 RepID=A0A2T4U7Z4_9BACI|nr:Cof-type HAD-IIB family hydrolase [Alkalicoccus saliphilus]PTL39527.1 phosphoglycolate phosphatase [Alkalicoccus saliphilus]
MNNYDIKMAVLDMDGTLLQNDHTISHDNREAVKKALENGVEVIIATGRSLQAVDMFADELSLKDYIITGNGSEIWHLSGPELIERSSLKAELVEAMWEIRNAYGTRHWAASVGKVWKQEMPDNLKDLEWLKFGFDMDSMEIKKEVLKKLEQLEGLEITNSSPLNIEVNAEGVHKAGAIETLLEFKNLSFNEVMAVGDSLNDISMIQAAGIGVAMGNAQDVVKEKADFITTANGDHGVAEAFRKFRLI